MRVAFVGKGGAGKSVVAGTFCRMLARTTSRGVVAIDSDPLPGLAFSLGVPSTDTQLPQELVEKVGDDPDSRWQLRPGMTVLEAVERYTLEGPDGVRFLQFGKLRGHVVAVGPSQQAFRVIVRELAETDLHLVGDLPGGTRQPFLGWIGFAEMVVVVAEATPSSMLSARRLARLADADGGRQVVAVANKTADPGDANVLQRFSGLRVVGEVPCDPAVGAAERAGVSLLDLAPTSPAAEAVSSLVDSLTDAMTKETS
ncbi:MAG: hypothetical protein H0U26_00035 [Acidimicrobiia bacterium]|nr:hypothetical protein [Acidimicrobiia bacterium]